VRISKALVSRVGVFVVVLALCSASLNTSLVYGAESTRDESAVQVSGEMSFRSRPMLYGGSDLNRR
jgi:hypothetical protein